MIKQYRVREKKHYGANNQYKSGDIVELEEAEAKNVLDLLEEVQGAPSKPSNPTIVADKAVVEDNAVVADNEPAPVPVVETNDDDVTTSKKAPKSKK